MDPYRYDEGPTNQIMLHIYEAMVAQNADMSFGLSVLITTVFASGASTDSKLDV